MICCKECLELLHDYIDGALSKEVKGALEEHFKDCPPCISFLNTYKATTKTCRQTLNTFEMPEEVAASLKSFIEKNIKNGL